MTGRVPRATVVGADEQDAEEIDVARWTALAESVLAAEGVPPRAELSLVFVDEATMADLNARHMAATGPTDVLAFPLEDPAEAAPENGRGPRTAEMPLLLGDVVVCPAVAARQAPENAGGGPHHAGRVEDEVALLVVHGILHVLGMDHAEPDEAEAMRTKERELLSRLHSSS